MELSYFQTALVLYLGQYHPHRLADPAFIQERSDEAARTFETARSQGCPLSEAMALAHEVLHAGLEFSAYQTLLSLLENDFAQVPAESHPTVALALLPACEQMLARYPIESGFEDTPLYRKLCYELIDLIDTHLHAHGLQ